MTEKKEVAQKKETATKKAAPKKKTATSEDVVLVDLQTGKKVTTATATVAKVSKESKTDISPYVSNVDGDVYAISGLPEEFVATLFAWVSRSPKSFKEHLRQALKEQGMDEKSSQFRELDEKARKFHEKWTVGYGHSSVAEHASTHVGIEKVSRLASAELELSNTFLSITEYSQRYQKPQRGEWHNPFEKMISHNGPTRDMKKNPLHEMYETFMNDTFDVFEELIEGVYNYLVQKDIDDGVLSAQSMKEQSARRNALQKLAFEDARYVLPLSMYTQLGMTANGRAWRDGIAKMGTSIYPEVHKLADDLRTEITKVLPVLLKHSTASPYQKEQTQRMRTLFNGISKSEPTFKAQLHSVKPEGIVIDEIIAHLYVEFEGRTFTDGLNHAASMKQEDKQNIIIDMLDQMAFFDVPPESFRHVHYKADFLVSEANWHQLLRHNRMTDFSYGRPSIYHGVVIPQRIKDAGLTHLFEKVQSSAELLYESILESDKPELADYVVLNAHNRQVTATFSLWEAYHLINLRTSEEAQWDIRETFEELYEQMKLVHPTLITKAQRR